ncbi:MAG: translocase FtsK/SpoIIIE protein [Candidatus Nomurabacteria bacterium GW2011_GWF2_35_12]|nr:MAG: translocase FtsK/SpoIIIE protein [Candidatus Nomurabacteria bacterium GW2011_GWF2_35_12]
MTKKEKRKQKFYKSTLFENRLKTETRHGIWAILFFALAMFLLMSMFSSAGKAGDFVYEFLNYFLGIGYILFPLLFVLLGSSFLKSEAPDIGWARAISGTMFLLSGLGMIDVVSLEHSGGFLGRILSAPLVSLFDVYASIIFLGAILIISILAMFDAKPDLAPFLKNIWNFIRRKKSFNNIEGTLNEDEKEKIKKAEEQEPLTSPLSGGPEKDSFPDKGKQEGLMEEEDLPIKKRKGGLISTYLPPPLSLLEEDQGKPNTGDIKANANIIKRTLANFGIEVEMDEITIGPTVTRYALKPAEGVKLSRIVGLQNDLALSLAAHPIRIEAPIPGKSLVGIEIPNKSKSIVGLATLLADSKFQNSSKPLTIALGREISGKAVFGNLGKMPHCLVAGTTGSGKSVTIHSMITSLLYRNGPDDLKFILIDPKRVELTLYNNIPHLLTPVITDAKKTILALKWAAREMDRRYDILEAESVRDIESYHANVWGSKKKTPPSSPLSGGENKGTSPDKESQEGLLDRLPYIIIVIDELADIMSSYPRELESAVVRLAQMSRAVGIHLILSTQRPEVNVITGLIKANIPARVALKVSSQVDSRTILDAGGAEKLLGAGDMLYSSGEAQPERLQSAFISESEVKKVVKYLADAYRDEISEEISLTTGSISADKSIFESTLDNEEDDDDEMYEEARLCVIEAGKASTSYLQRKLKLGYARAARLMDKLEERGVISAGDGAKPREVLEKITHDENGENVVE